MKYVTYWFQCRISKVSFNVVRIDSISCRFGIPSIQFVSIWDTLNSGNYWSSAKLSSIALTDLCHNFQLWISTSTSHCIYWYPLISIQPSITESIMVRSYAYLYLYRWDILFFPALLHPGVILLTYSRCSGSLNCNVDSFRGVHISYYVDSNLVAFVGIQRLSSLGAPSGKRPTLLL